MVRAILDGRKTATRRVVRYKYSNTEMNMHTDIFRGRRNDMDSPKVCFSCANCSEHYPSMKDSCDIDEHEIKDVFVETCEKFIKADDYGELVD